MKHSSRTQSINWFQDHYKSGRLKLRPPFQRKPVWKEKQRNFLIESILLNIPVPEIYIQVTQDADGQQEMGVVDGQQRLRTILQFIGIETSEDQNDDEDNNAFALNELADTSPFFELEFSDLDDDTRKKFFRYEICVRELWEEDTAAVEDVFKRLNKYTLPLKAQELRNATYHGAFAKLSESLADDDYWAVNRIVSPQAIRRMADIEMMSDLLVGLIHGPQGGSAKTLNEYYDQFEQYDLEFPEQPKIKRLFIATRDLIKTMFPDIADAPRWGNRADFYSLFVALATLLKARPIKSSRKLAKRLSEFGLEVNKRMERPGTVVSKEAKLYTLAVEKGVNDRARRAERHAQLLTVMQPFFGEDT